MYSVRCCVNIYDLISLKRCKTLHFPADVPTPEAESLAFNYDSKGISVLSREPNAFLTIFYFDKAETVVCGRVSIGTKTLPVARHVSGNLSDTGLVVVTGEHNSARVYTKRVANGSDAARR